MTKSLPRKSFLLVLVPIVLMVVLFYVLQWKAKVEVENFLNRKIPDNIAFNYDELKVSVIKGNFLFSNPHIEIRNNANDTIQLTVDLEEIRIEDIHYWKFFNDKEIIVDKILIISPDFIFQTSPGNKKEKSDKIIKLLKPIHVEDLGVENGSIKIIQDRDSEVLKLDSLYVNLEGGYTNFDIINKKIPFAYNSVDIHFREFSASLGKFESIDIAKVQLSENRIRLNKIHFFTKFSKKDLNQVIAHERDHIDLEITEASVADIDFGFENDSLVFTSKSSMLSGLDLEMFRDKNVADDLSNKPLYAKMLRSLPIKFSIETFGIANSRLSYKEEELGKENSGELRFEDISGKIKNLNNLAGDEKVKIVLDSKLMGEGEMHMDWSFNVNDPDQRFLVKGSLDNLNTKRLNDFLTPTLNVQTEGIIDQLYFTISGDEYVANGDVKMNYNDFRFQVLNKDRLKINKVLTFIGNLFIDDGSKADEDGYRYGQIENVERDQTKSFFNYLWISLKEGLLHVLSGNGKKK